MKAQLKAFIQNEKLFNFKAFIHAPETNSLSLDYRQISGEKYLIGSRFRGEWTKASYFIPCSILFNVRAFGCKILHLSTKNSIVSKKSCEFLF